MSGGLNETSITWFRGVKIILVGGDGIVYGIIATDADGAEYPAAFSAATATEYCVPFTNPLLIWNVFGVAEDMRLYAPLLIE